MYTEYWKMMALPFENAPDPNFFYESPDHREGITRLMFAIQSRKAIALITGDYGSGKSMMCQTAVRRLDANSFQTTIVTQPRMDAIDLTREIAYQFGEDIKTRSKYDTLHAFNNLLERHYGAGRHCAAIIDEAQLIDDSSIFEDIRLLLNHQVDGHHLMTLVLVGQTELTDTLRPIPQMAQRIGLKYHIPHLNTDQITAYIQHRLQVVGSKLEIFEDAAIVSVGQLSNGNPREINALCDMALLTACLSDKTHVTREDIEDAGQERV